VRVEQRLNRPFKNDGCVALNTDPPPPAKVTRPAVDPITEAHPALSMAPCSAEGRPRLGLCPNKLTERVPPIKGFDSDSSQV
jgi:hypothetical protein